MPAKPVFGRAVALLVAVGGELEMEVAAKRDALVAQQAAAEARMGRRRKTRSDKGT
jgi:hypothetical protein